MNRRRILLIVVRLLAFAAVAEALTIWVFWRSPWTPVERHYLPAYFASSLPLVGPSTVEVRWIWKIGQHQKRQLLANDDAVDSPDRIGMALSPSALGAGWKTLIEGPRQQIPADELRPYLSNLAFEGESYGNSSFSGLSALAALCASLFVWFLVIGFLRVLIADYAWRRGLYSRRELLPSLFNDCTTLASRLCSRVEVLYQNASRRMALHPPVMRTEIVQSVSPARTLSFAIPVFGVHNGKGPGHLWGDNDEID